MCKPPDSHHEDSEGWTESETPSETDDIEYLRAKWMFDGAKTLDEVIERLQARIEEIRSLKADGWELIGEVQDDYGPMVKQAAQ